MLIIPSPLFTSFRNKFGTSVLYPIAGRQIGREFVVPFNPETAEQSAVRGDFGNASIAYSLLTPAEKAAWEALASSVTITDAYGQETTIPAKAMYMRVNAYRQLNGQAITDTAPSIDSHPIAQIVDDIPVVIATGAATITISASPVVFPVDALYFVRMTAPLPGTTRVARRTDLRQLNDLSASSFVPATTTSAMAMSSADLRFTYADQDRVGLEIVTLTADYVPLGSAFAPDVLVDVVA